MLGEKHVFRDEGYSGARLDRPGLDALRDVVRDGAVDLVAVLSPDRLARRYAYQVLLLEEFRSAGCEVVFLQHPISDDPNDQLCCRSRAPSPSTSAPCWASASGVASYRRRVMAITSVAVPLTATATCHA